MSATLTPFTNDEFSLTLTLVDDALRADAVDVARALSFRDTRDLLRGIPEDEQGVTHSDAGPVRGGSDQRRYLTEAGFYRALGQRQAARITDPVVRGQVERFQTWVYGTVLPSFRRGEVAFPQPRLPMSYADALRELATTVEERDKAREHVAELTPRAESADAFAATPGDFKMGTAAQMMGTGRGRFFDWLRDEKVLQASDGGRPYQRYADWFHVVPSTIDLANGERKVNYTCYVTGEGLHAIYRLLRKRGYPVRQPDVQLALLSADARYGETPQLTS